VCADGFLGDLRRTLAKKLPRTAGFAMERLTVSVSNWMGNSFMSFVEVLEALSNREFNPNLGDFEIDAKNHRWKEQTTRGHNESSSWCFSTMVVVEKICDLFKTVDFKGVRKTSLDKEVSAGYKNVFVLHNGDIVAAVPPLHMTFSKKWRGTLSYVEAVDVSFSTVFIANVEETKPKFPLKVRYLWCRQLSMFFSILFVGRILLWLSVLPVMLLILL
jgi:hypothetical protein